MTFILREAMLFCLNHGVLALLNPAYASTLCPVVFRHCALSSYALTRALRKYEKKIWGQAGESNDDNNNNNIIIIIINIDMIINNDKY